MPRHALPTHPRRPASPVSPSPQRPAPLLVGSTSLALVSFQSNGVTAPMKGRKTDSAAATLPAVQPRHDMRADPAWPDPPDPPRLPRLPHASSPKPANPSGAPVSRRLPETLTELQSPSYVLRVHSALSYSPLFWADAADASDASDAASPDARARAVLLSGLAGFAAPNAHFHLSPAAYARAVAVLASAEAAGWARGDFVRQAALDHALARHRLTAPDVGGAAERVPEDERSPWVSAGADAFWAVWAVARRLARGEGAVGLAVIEVRRGAPGRSRWEGGGGGWGAKTGGITGASGELALELAGRLTEPRGKATLQQRAALDQARYTAGASAEVVFLGRVFPRSIIADYEWSAEADPPILLPPYFFRPRTHTATSAPGQRGWLSELAWDAGADDVEAARGRVVERRQAYDRGAKTAL